MEQNLLIAAGVILLLTVAYAQWRCKYRAKPRCSRWRDPAMRAACWNAKIACKEAYPRHSRGRAACINTVAHCMPLIDALNSDDAPADLAALEPKLVACIHAAAKLPSL